MKAVTSILTLSVIAAATITLAPTLFSDSATIEHLYKDKSGSSYDDAVYQSRSVGSYSMDVPRPAVEQEAMLTDLLSADAANFAAASALAEVKIALNKPEEAVQVMDGFLTANPEQFEAVAAFYGQRRQVERQLAILDKGAESLDGAEQVVVLKRINQLRQRHLLTQPAASGLYQRMIAAEPKNIEHVLDFAKYLDISNQQQAAVDLLTGALESFPDKERMIKSRLASLYQKMGETETALALYDGQFSIDGELDGFASYVQILQEADRYIRWKRDLQRQARQGTLGEEEFVALFMLYRHEGNWNDAERLLQKHLAVAKPATAADILQYARAFKKIEKQDSVRRLAYYAYIRAEADASKAEALLLMVESVSNTLWDRTHLFADAFTSLDPSLVDGSPGIVGGLLSLQLNSVKTWQTNDDLITARAQQEKVQLMQQWFSEYTENYANRADTARIYAAMVAAMTRIGKHTEAVMIAEEFFNGYATDPGFNLVAREALPAYRALEKTASVANTYAALVNWADRHGSRDDYYSAISDLARHLAGEQEMTAVVKLYWDQIQKYPQDQQLYDRFLDFLSRYRIFDEQEKVYKRAIEQFETNDYYDKLARFYIRQKQDDSLKNFAREVAEIFKDSELHNFLRTFINPGRNAEDADTRFYQTMYEYANRRFPRNLNFVNDLLNYYQRFKLWDAYERLAFRYFYADDSIRRRLLARLSETDKLNGLLNQVDGSTPQLQAATGEVRGNTAELLLVMAGRNWQSYFESALPYAAALAERNPEFEPFKANHARLLRSLEKQEAAEVVYSELISINPLFKDYMIKAGELAVEREGAATAAQYWLQIPEIEPADEGLYRETATLFWDYYQYDDAVAVLLNARQRLNNDNLFGIELGILQEEKGDYQAAIDEYIRFASRSDAGSYRQQQALDRLQQLAENLGKEELVMSGFAASLESSDYSYEAVQTLDRYLGMVEKDQQQQQLLRTATQQFEKLESLRWLTGRLRSERMIAEEEQALLKIAAITDNERQTMNSLASLYERTDRFADAENIYIEWLNETRTTEPELLPDYLQALQGSADFYWRNERVSAAAALWKEQVSLTEGYQQKQLIVRSAQRLRDREQYQEASWFAAKGLETDPIDQQYFNAMAAIHAAQQDYAQLSDLFKTTIAAIRNADSMSREVRKQRIQTLRLGLIDNLVVIGDHMAVVDQYIELINAEPESEYLVERAWRHAENHDLSQRLLNYYQQTAERSFKDYRWQVVLADLNRQSGNYLQVKQHLEAAVRLEPQRTDLRNQLAQTYIATEDYQLAAEQFDQIYRLDQANQFWQQQRAQVYRLMGETDTAVEILLEILAQSSDSTYRYFEIARTTREWGLLETASDLVASGVERVKSDLYDYVPNTTDFTTIVDVYVESGAMMRAFNTLLDINRAYADEANRSGNNRAYLARQGQSRSYNAFSGAFATAMQKYADTADRKAMELRLRNFLGANAPESTWQWVQAVARPLDFAKLEEECLQRLLAFKASDKTKNDYRQRLQALLEFYQGHQNPVAIAATMTAELEGERIRGYLGTMLQMEADAYNYLGDSAALRASLERYWQTYGKGSANFGTIDEYAERYLELLHEAGDTAALSRIADSAGNFSGQVINFLGRNGYDELMIRAIASLEKGNSKAWVDSKKLLMGMKADMDQSAWQLSGSPADLMRDYSIGRRVSTMPDTATFFSANNWYQFLGHYASYVLASGDEAGAFKLINSLAEGGASSGDLYRRTAHWYASHKQWTLAEERLQAAVTLEGRTSTNLMALGKLKLAQGDRAAAVAFFQEIVAGKPSFQNYLDYFMVMRDEQFFAEAKPIIEQLVAERIGETSSWQMDDVLYQIADWTKVLDEEAYLVDLLIKRSATVKQPIDLLSSSFYNLNLGVKSQTALMKALIEKARAASLAEDDTERSVPLLKSWLEEAISFASEHSLYPLLLEWVELYQQRGYDENPTYRLGGREDFAVLKAVALFGTGEDQQARQFVEAAISDSELPMGESAVQSLANKLKAMNKAAVGVDLQVYFYEYNLGQGNTYSGYQMSLLKLLMSRKAEGDTERGLQLVDGLVQQSVDTPSLLEEAAVILQKAALLEPAIDLRQQYAQLRPRDFDNQTALAEALANSGDQQAALTLYRKLFAERTPAPTRFHAITGYVEVATSTGAAEELALYRAEALQARDQPTAVLAHALANAAGDSAAQQEITAAMRQNGHEPALYLAWIGGVAPYVETDAMLLQESISLLDNKRVAGMLLKEYLKNGGKVRAVSDDWQYTHYQPLSRDDFDRRFDLRNRELAELLPAMVDHMIALGDLDSALHYEQLRSTIANELSMTITSREEQIESMLAEQQQARDEFVITPAVSNE